MFTFRVLLIALSLCLATPLKAETASQVVSEIARQWAADFARQDAEGLASHYTTDALFYGSKPVLYAGRDQITDYFRNMPKGLKGAKFDDLQVVELAPGILSAAGFITFIQEINETEKGFPYRVTWVLVRGANGWLIANHHTSPKPQ